jgi:hypothetical protein
MKHPRQPGNPLDLSYLELRTAVGIIGLALPFVLSIGGVIAGVAFPDSSLSIYYHTPVRNWFVASLSVIGVFLAGCRGYDRRDEIAGYIAGFCAIAVVFVPTVGPGQPEDTVGLLHYSFAAILFFTLSYFCLVLFRLTSQPGNETPQKRRRNVVYLVCGIVILASIAAIGLLALIAYISKMNFWPTSGFWFESTAILAFGFAWLTKGEAILKDKPHEHEEEDGNRTAARFPVTAEEAEPDARSSSTLCRYAARP